MYALDEFPELDKQKKHTIEIVVDRLTNTEENLSRLTQSVEQAFSIADDKLIVHDADKAEDRLYSLKYACVDHPEIQIPELEPRTFSFNNPQGACSVCTGLGNRLEVDPDLLLNRNLTIAEGAIRPWNRFAIDAWYMKKVAGVAEQHNFSVHIPVKDLSEEQLQVLLYGSGSQKFDIELSKGRSYETTYEGIIPNLERRHKDTESEFMRKDIEKFMVERPCHACKGKRLKAEVLAVTVGDRSIIDVCEMNIDVAFEYVENLKLEGSDAQIAQMILKEIKNRLGFLIDVGLNYLSLSRSATTLSGGEAQRIRLATQIGSGLMGVLYVLDEPSIGLHQRDNERLIRTLKHMRDLGNTVLVVEHDEETIRTADYLIDIGPGAGVHGGQIIAEGTPRQVADNKQSITGQYLVGAQSIPVPKSRRKGTGKVLKVVGANENNLRDVTVEIPLGQMVVVSGVSGSGKSSLINDIVADELSSRLHNAHVVPGKHESLEGVEHLDKAIIIDQSPIGRTPRSNPATYTGLFTPIRDLYASLPEAKIRGYKTGRFSFNVKGGRCENCQGDGIIKIEMHFLPDVYVQCEICKGRRYNREALEVTYKGKSIADVLEMTCEDALGFFENQPGIARKLQTLVEVGLGYITLGQPATTLSGGEAQRVKLATELSRRATGRTLYILDEPTTGLHIHDVRKLLEVLQALVDTGNSMIIIEHNLDVVKSADYVIDMGPEGGSGGGLVIAKGTPEQIAKVSESYTGQFLKNML
jgi:excinuclease ABC subunit A